jgi:hypothetical protein
MPAPACSMRKSGVMPRAKAACSASRICAELRIGDSTQFSVALEELFFFLVELLLLLVLVLELFFFFDEELDLDFDLELWRFERERSGSRK